MKLTITGGQLRKYKTGQSFQLSKNQLRGEAKTGKQHEIDLDESHRKKLQSAVRRGKGYRVKGGSILGSISKGVNKAVKTVSDAGKKTSSKWSKGIADAAKSAADYVENDAMDDIKDTYGEVSRLTFHSGWVSLLHSLLLKCLLCFALM
jgi:hypothetical protein